jgi:hypothetical protein
MTCSGYSRWSDVDLPYTAQAHQRRPRARSGALVAHPCEDLWSVDEVTVRRERDGREGLAVSLQFVYVPVLVKMCMFISLPCRLALHYGTEVVVHGSTSLEARAGNDVATSNSSIEVAGLRHLCTQIAVHDADICCRS